MFLLGVIGLTRRVSGAVRRAGRCTHRALVVTPMTDDLQRFFQGLYGVWRARRRTPSNTPSSVEVSVTPSGFLRRALLVVSAVGGVRGAAATLLFVLSPMPAVLPATKALVCVGTRKDTFHFETAAVSATSFFAYNTLRCESGKTKANGLPTHGLHEHLHELIDTVRRISSRPQPLLST